MDLPSFSFLEHFRWTEPARPAPTWADCYSFISARRARHAEDVVRIERFLTESDERLEQLGGDPLRESWTAFRPLSLAREEGWSDWLAHVIATSKTGAFAHAILGGDLRRDAFANKPSVKREWTLPGGYRADLGVSADGGGSWIHVEVKIGDQDLEKTIDTGEAMRAWARPASVRDVLLLPRADRLLWNDVLKRPDTAQSKRAHLAHAISVIDWHQVATALRSTLTEADEPVSWRVFARTFCGAVEQLLLGLPQIHVERGLRALSIFELEAVVEHKAALTLQDHNR